MSDHRKDFPDFYVTGPQPCPYLSGRLERKLFTHLRIDKSDATIDTLLRNGFRRSQNIAYVPYCDGCSACVSVRIPVDLFKPSKSQKRIMKRNAAVVAHNVPNTPTGEQYSVFRGYIDDRHGDGGMADMTVGDFSMMVRDSVVDTCIREYRVPRGTSPGEDAAWDEWRAAPSSHGHRPGELIGAVLCDRLADGLSMVYSFFEPDYREDSLGTYMILEHIEEAKRLGLDYVYLGYWISGSRKMAYKSKFRPQEHLTPEGWVLQTE